MPSKPSRPSSTIASGPGRRPTAGGARLRTPLRTTWTPATAALAAVAAGAFLAPPSSHADEALHLRLLATSPAADSVITESPEEVRLWFSEPPQAGGTAVRLTDEEGELVPSTEAAPDDEDPTQVFIRPRGRLAPGAYTVHWRVIAQDGHAQNGSFAFELRRR